VIFLSYLLILRTSEPPNKGRDQRSQLPVDIYVSDLLREFGLRAFSMHSTNNPLKCHIFEVRDLVCTCPLDLDDQDLLQEFSSACSRNPLGGFFISFRKLNSTYLQCRMASRLIWSCSPRSLESCTTYGT
jgi:hypothetical protein